MLWRRSFVKRSVIFLANVLYREFTYAGADGVSLIHAYVWSPASGKPRAVIQLSHGMCEYVQRYEPWARRFAEAGYVFCGNDHIGHGHTATDAVALGYTAKRRGAAYMTADLYTLTMLMREEYKDVPVILYGHSMGSFVARKYMTQYADLISGVILSGTAGPGAPAGVAKALAHSIELFSGAHHRSPLIFALAFGSYGKRFKEEKDSASWLTREPSVRDAYRADPFCAYQFTLAGYDTLFSLIGEVSSKKWANGVRKDMPVLLLSGDMDPVGDYGRGVRKVYDRMQRAGCDVRLKLYENGRHEMHNETNRDEVFTDLIAYLEEIIA